MTVADLTDREKFLLSVIAYLDDMDSWYLDESPAFCERLRDEFDYTRGEDD